MAILTVTWERRTLLALRIGPHHQTAIRNTHIESNTLKRLTSCSTSQGLYPSNEGASKCTRIDRSTRQGRRRRKTRRRRDRC